MKAIELEEIRVGNMYQNKSGWQSEIQADDFMNLYVNGSNGWYAIELNEEWLVKLGFKDYKHTDNPEYLNEYHEDWERVFYFPESTLYLNNPRNKGWFAAIQAACYDESTGLWAISQEIKYVHQLQNLFFALTGMELMAMDK